MQAEYPTNLQDFLGLNSGLLGRMKNKFSILFPLWRKYYIMSLRIFTPIEKRGACRIQESRLGMAIETVQHVLGIC